MIVVDGVVVGQAARDSMAAELQAAAAKASASATLRRLFDGLTLTPEQESTALDVILATQKEIRALAPPRRPARLRIPPVGGIVSMQATSAEELLSFVADDTDRAKVRARIVIIPQ